MASAGEQVMDRVTKLPTAQKVAIMVTIAGLLTVGNYFAFIDPDLTEFDAQVKKMRNLEGEVIQAQAIANNLNQYRKEKELLEQQLAKALTELPEDANIPDLIKSLNELAAKAELTINNLEPGVEKNGESSLYAQIPLTMAVTGTYHQIAVFFDSVRQLKRIVNISGIHMTNPHLKNDKVLLSANYTATSFRFLPQPKNDKSSKKSAPK